MPITSDPERIAKVAGEIMTAVRDRVRLPVLGRADAAGITMAMLADLDEAIVERTARAAELGHHIACSAGCSACCVSPLLVSEGEAVTVEEWLVQPENAAVLAGFLARYPAWRRGLGDAVNAFANVKTDADRLAAATLVKTKAVMCAFNADGMCSIYPPRPARCRRALALETNANCGVEGTGEVKYFEHPRTEVTFEEQEPMRNAMHKALRPNAPFELLPAAVFRLLFGSLSRNAPCPCGSGKKLKLCCGA